MVTKNRAFGRNCFTRKYCNMFVGTGIIYFVPISVCIRSMCIEVHQSDLMRNDMQRCVSAHTNTFSVGDKCA